MTTNKTKNINSYKKDTIAKNTNKKIRTETQK